MRGVNGWTRRPPVSLPDLSVDKSGIAMDRKDSPNRLNERKAGL